MSPVRTTILSFLHVVLSYVHGPAARVVPAIMRTIGGAADQTASPPYESRVAATLSPGGVESPAPAGRAAGLRMVGRYSCVRHGGVNARPSVGRGVATIRLLPYISLAMDAPVSMDSISPLAGASFLLHTVRI